MNKSFTLESFKDALNFDKALKKSLVCSPDIFDENNGVAVIHEENLSKYLEKYMCKDQEELSDFLYFNKGIFLKIVQ